jgi:hypothetical protein
VFAQGHGAISATSSDAYNKTFEFAQSQLADLAAFCAHAH